MASWQTIEDVANVSVSPELVMIAEVRAPHHHRIGVLAVSQIDALVTPGDAIVGMPAWVIARAELVIEATPAEKLGDPHVLVGAKTIPPAG